MYFVLVLSSSPICNILSFIRTINCLIRRVQNNYKRYIYHGYIELSRTLLLSVSLFLFPSPCSLSHLARTPPTTNCRPLAAFSAPYSTTSHFLLTYFISSHTPKEKLYILQVQNFTWFAQAS